MTIVGGPVLGLLLAVVAGPNLGVGGAIGGVIDPLLGVPIAAIPGVIGGVLGTWSLRRNDRRWKGEPAA